MSNLPADYLMPPSTKPVNKNQFKWESSPSSFVYKQASATVQDIILFRIRKDDENQYVQLGHKLYSNMHIEVDDLIARVSDTVGRKKILDADIAKGWPTCKLWKSDGTLIAKLYTPRTRSELALPPFLEALIKPKSSRKAIIYSNYRAAWDDLLKDALQIAKEKVKDIASKFDVNSRFFVVPKAARVGPLQLQFVVVANVAWLEPGLSDLCAEVGKTRKAGEEKQCTFTARAQRFQSAQTAKNEGYVAISSHPLGFYTTYVNLDNLEKLVNLQAGDAPQKWYRPLPTADKVHDMEVVLVNTGLDSKKPKFKQCCIGSTTTSAAHMLPKTKIAKVKREATLAIMGDSANKWGMETLNWEAPPKVAAEWLHRIAHRFEGSKADRFNNLIFGTSECNTNMIRAETVVNSLLLSPKKIKNVTVTATARDTKTVPMLNRTLKPDAVTIPWYNDEEDIEGYYYWMTPSLDYEIKWETVTGDPGIGLTTFYPFHRYTPLAYEIELDKLVLAKYMKSIKASRNINGPDDEVEEAALNGKKSKA